MRSLLLVLFLCSAASAQPKKTPVDRFTKAAGDAFKAALAADEANDLPTALGLYKKAFAISPHPSTAYNIADVHRRRGELAEAIQFYEIYLALGPPAKEVKEVEALIEKLWATPAVMELISTAPSDPESVDLESAYVLVNGVIVKKAGEPAGFDSRDRPRVELSVPAGLAQTIDVVTPLSYNSVRCSLPPGKKSKCEIRVKPRIDGSLVVSTSEHRRRLQVSIDVQNRVDHERVNVPPGRHRFEVRDNNLECAGGVTVDVPKGTDVAYVFIDGPPTSFYQRCRPFKVKQYKLTFAN